MSDLLQKISETAVAKGSVSAWWLSGSGFVFKAPDGAQIWIDPYLSNSVQAVFGMGRAVPIPIRPEDARPAAVISTHWHEDHLDVGTIPMIAKYSPHTQFVMPPSAMARATSWGVPPARITPLQWGETTAIGDATIEAIPARHEAGILGWDVPDAMGVMIQIGGVTIYHAGDTEYDLRLRALKTRAIDAALLCSNGVTGNMDMHEAALLAWQIGARLSVPVHHLLWDKNPADATLDPALFAQTYRNLGGLGRVIAPVVGEEIVIGT